MASLNIIDQIAMEFETHWNPRLEIATIPTFVDDKDLNDEEKQVILVELMMIDIDRRWQEFGQQVNGQTLPDPVLTLKQAIPSAAAYIQFVSKEEPAIQRQILEELIEHEFVTRARLGDISRPADVISKDIVERIKAARPTFEVSINDSVKFRQKVWGNLVVGRQNWNEPAPFQILETGQCCKLICATTDYDRISRRQVFIEMLTP